MLKSELRADDRVTDEQTSRNDQGDDEHLEELLCANCSLTLSDNNQFTEKPFLAALTGSVVLAPGTSRNLVSGLSLCIPIS